MKCRQLCDAIALMRCTDRTALLDGGSILNGTVSGVATLLTEETARSGVNAYCEQGSYIKYRLSVTKREI